MYLLDTNIWLERLLDQEKSEEIGNFLDKIPSEHFYITDFSFHSIAIVLSKLEKTGSLIRFVQDAFIDGAITLLHLEPDDTDSIVNVMQEFNLDFDDAYQYVAAKKHNLTIISFDSDFDRTELKRNTPEDAHS